MLQNVFAVWTSIAVILGAIFFWAWPSALGASSVGEALGHLVDVWNVLYLTGGTLSLVGLAAKEIRLEIAGKSLLVPAFIIQASAQGYVLGARAIPTALVIASLGIACVIRIFMLLEANKIARELADS